VLEVIDAELDTLFEFDFNVLGDPDSDCKVDLEGVTYVLTDINGVLLIDTLAELEDVELDEGKGDPETVLLLIAEYDLLLNPECVTYVVADNSGVFVLLIKPLVELEDVELDEGKGDPETVLLLITEYDLLLNPEGVT